MPSAHPQLDLDAQLCFPLYAAARAVTGQYADLLDEVGLTYPQYLCLLTLWSADEPLTIGEVGRRLRLDSGTLTPVMKRLEAAGHVHRERDPADERRVRVVLTNTGRALQDRVAEVPGRLWERLDLTAEDASDLRRLLDGILRALPA
ncbi:MarR family winged helix-turn-helix transcriptional regulator [Nocardioides massiliensis]|uniref:DNA-binding MarR family transcriptional regulator n=1 Tax=Nocardioides massiliensis TaxID=1325935 RepID=A0ABT9NKV5_9ACTN|nr:MarR family transcriptional regulator [Nocardioides massiliensis]MDP9821028.1 DNA-binding MarR family transcriptional regulator [Nocardioides massiliensis]